MLIQVESQSGVTAREVRKTEQVPESGEQRTLSAGETLFREGEARAHAFRIVTGAVCLLKSMPDGGQVVIEFAFPGDLVGLGYLDSHVSSAQATMETTVRCLSRSALDSEGADDVQARARLTAAIEREVAFLTEGPRPQTAPLQQIAALFVTLSRNNSYEGRDPSILTDSLKCGVVAGYLGMGVDRLAALLADLEKRGLVEPCAEGLRLKDLPALEALADGQP